MPIMMVLIFHALTCKFPASDVSCSEEIAKGVFNLMSRAPKEFHSIPDGPHFLSWTHALYVNTLLANFLDQTTGVDSRQTVLKLTKRRSFFRRIL